jgi:hypothetical protein
VGDTVCCEYEDENKTKTIEYAKVSRIIAVAVRSDDKREWYVWWFPYWFINLHKKHPKLGTNLLSPYHEKLVIEPPIQAGAIIDRVWVRFYSNNIQFFVLVDVFFSSCSSFFFLLLLPI